MLTADDAKLMAETMVSTWHRDFRAYLGGGGGVDWQARVGLIRAVTEALMQVAGEQDEAERDASQLRRRRARGCRSGGLIMVLPFLLAGAGLAELAENLPKHSELSPKSSFIASADYEPLSGTLTVTMQNGNRYEYPNVDQGTYDAFVDAVSPGVSFSIPTSNSPALVGRISHICRAHSDCLVPSFEG